VIRSNVTGWGVEGAFRVLECAVEKSRGALSAIQPIDLVLSDPPWKVAVEAGAVVAEVVRGLLSPSATVVLGHASRDELVIAEGSGLELVDRRAWGDSALSFFSQSE
jgi:16S rRNA G966 N2-methylase RsmD